MRYFDVDLCPSREARCKGVSPSSFSTSSLAPFRTNSLPTVNNPFLEACLNLKDILIIFFKAFNQLLFNVKIMLLYLITYDPEKLSKSAHKEQNLGLILITNIIYCTLLASQI